MKFSGFQTLLIPVVALLSGPASASPWACHTEDADGGREAAACVEVESTAVGTLWVRCETHRGSKTVEMAKGRARLSYLDDEYAQAIQRHYDSYDLSALIFVKVIGNGEYAFSQYDVLLCRKTP